MFAAGSSRRSTEHSLSMACSVQRRSTGRSPIQAVGRTGCWPRRNIAASRSDSSTSASGTAANSPRTQPERRDRDLCRIFRRRLGRRRPRSDDRGRDANGRSSLSDIAVVQHIRRSAFDPPRLRWSDFALRRHGPFDDQRRRRQCRPLRRRRSRRQRQRRRRHSRNLRQSNSGLPIRSGNRRQRPRRIRRQPRGSAGVDDVGGPRASGMRSGSASSPTSIPVWIPASAEAPAETSASAAPCSSCRTGSPPRPAAASSASARFRFDASASSAASAASCSSPPVRRTAGSPVRPFGSRRTARSPTRSETASSCSLEQG